MAEELLELKVANDLTALPHVATDLEAFCGRHGIPYRDANRFNLALEEVLTNTISYGFLDGGLFARNHDLARGIEVRRRHHAQ